MAFLITDEDTPTVAQIVAKTLLAVDVDKGMRFKKKASKDPLRAAFGHMSLIAGHEDARTILSMLVGEIVRAGAAKDLCTEASSAITKAETHYEVRLETVMFLLHAVPHAAV